MICSFHTLKKRLVFLSNNHKCILLFNVENARVRKNDTNTRQTHMLNTDEVIIFVPMCDPRAHNDTQTNEAC